MKLLIIIISFGLLSISCNTKKENMATINNPLLVEYSTPFNVPPFDKIKTEHYMPAFIEGMKQQNIALEKKKTDTIRLLVQCCAINNNIRYTRRTAIKSRLRLSALIPFAFGGIRSRRRPALALCTTTIV